MTFDEVFHTVKKKLDSCSEIILKCENLAVQIKDIADVFSHAFYIIYKDGRCISDRYHCDEYDVCITGTQTEIELMFTEHQYLVQGNNQLDIEGSFSDVMLFQKLLSHITTENTYTVGKETISEILYEQTILRKDLDIVMQILQLMLTDSLIALPENYTSAKKAEQNPKKTEQKRKNQSKENPIGQKVRLSPKCKFCEHNGVRKTVESMLDAPTSYIFEIRGYRPNFARGHMPTEIEKYFLYVVDNTGKSVYFWVDEKYVIPVE